MTIFVLGTDIKVRFLCLSADLPSKPITALLIEVPAQMSVPSATRVVSWRNYTRKTNAVNQRKYIKSVQTDFITHPARQQPFKFTGLVSLMSLQLGPHFKNVDHFKGIFFQWRFSPVLGLYISLDRFLNWFRTSLLYRQHSIPAPSGSLSFQTCITSTICTHNQASKAHSSVFTELWLQVKTIPLRHSHNGDVYDVLFSYRNLWSWK